MYLFEIFGLELDFQPLIEELRSWWAGLLKHLPNILLAIIVIAIGFMVTKFAKRYIDRVSRRMVHDSTVAGLIASILTALVVLAFLFLTLSVLQLTGVVATILGAAGVVGLALGLAFQDPILNLFSGIMLSIRNLFKEGDLIEVSGYFGKVQKVNLRNTILMTLQGQEVLIPNKTVAQEPIKNYNRYGMRRVDIGCGVSYGDDLSKVRELTIKAIKDSVAYDTSKDVQLFFNEFGNSSINYTLRFWIAENKTGQADFLSAQSEAIMAIKRVYDDNDIMIPFPIRTLDFGIKGGEKLSEMLGSGKNDNSGDQNFDNEHQST